MATLRRLVLVMALFWLTSAVTAPGAALAEPPLRLPATVVDRAGALAGDDGPVRAAIDRLRQEKRIDLFVVYVSSFDAAAGPDWAEQTARLSQLGPRDALLAVAVDDRAYGYWVDPDFPVSDSTLDDIITIDVEPRLGPGDWAGAAVALADGLRTGRPSGGGSGGSGPSIGWVVGGTGALIGGAYLLNRRRKRRPAPTGTDATAPAAPADEFSGVSTTDLGYRASSALIELDDAVRTSEQELDLARAQFGEESVTEFRAALDASRGEMVRAFGVRQQLDDEVPEDDAAQRGMLADILRLCRSADERLDTQAAAFDRLRDLERTAPEVIAALGPSLDAATVRLPQAADQLGQLQQRYAAAALTAVAENLAQARSRLTVAGTEIEQARTALAAGSRGAAVVSARAAEDALAQAGTLLDAITRLADELAQAHGRIVEARAELEQDIAEARAIDGTAPTVARAEAALAAAERDLAPSDGLPDPLAALRRLAEADAAVDAGLVAARDAAQTNQRATAQLDRALLTARSAVAATSDFVTTRRGAIGSEARTRLAEAQRHLDLASGLAGDDPAAALSEAIQAGSLAQEAQRLAQADVDGWSAPAARTSGSTAGDLAGVILGGILFGDHGSGGGFGGSRGNGGWGGSGGFSPGSFGGSGTRGRRGGGGRF